ncbi:MAG: type II toxin-antitoxin system HigB family toxin [Steroidobacteraceae bacterium]
MPNEISTRLIWNSSRCEEITSEKKSHPRASILRRDRVVFNIKVNGCRSIAVIQYSNGILMIRFFGSHEEYDRVDAEAV